MNPRASELIRDLVLAPHPEGGFYREVFRSAVQVNTRHGTTRSALTTIHFLLAAGSFSAWHRVRADEVWHWYEGDALELLMVSPDFSQTSSVHLGPVRAGTQPVATVPADWWQAARPLGDYTLVGCTVAPGFDFTDFALLRDLPDAERALRNAAPALAALQ